jgi:hypothetical protein
MVCHFTRVLRERKLLRQNVTTEACDTRKSGTMLSQYQRKQGPMLYLVRVLGDNGRSLSFLLSEKTKKRIYRGDQLLFISIPTKSGTVETEVSLKRCGPPNGAEGERNGAFDQPTLSGFSLLRYGVLLLGKTSSNSILNWLWTSTSPVYPFLSCPICIQHRSTAGYRAVRQVRQSL